ncbi:MAG: DUF4342 domain-containing protein [Romboutsia sp.]
MNKITMEQIDTVKNRANVGYKEAKEILEKFDGDVVQSILYLEEQNKIKSDIKIANTTYFKKAKSLVYKLNKINVEIYKKEKTVLKIPMSLAILFSIIGLPAVAVGLVIAIFTGHRIKIENSNGEGYEINEKLDIVAEKAVNLAKKTTNEINKL